MSYLFMAKTTAAVLATPRNTHRGRPSPNPKCASETRYPGATPPPFSSNVHGEVERLPGGSGVEVTHWFVEAAKVVFHLVTAGNPERETILFLHGLPESWYAWHQQIADLAQDYHVVAVDMKGYGQSDKRLELDYRASTMAAEIAALMDVLGIERFNMVSHDRGVIITDHLPAVHGMQERILRYVRMQQSANEQHGKPIPPHKMFGSRLGTRLFSSAGFPRNIYAHRGYCTVPLSEEELNRIDFEVKVEGVAPAVSKYFRTTSFEEERADRLRCLFKHMNMPLLFLQGRHDPGQHPEEYERSAEFVREGYVRVVDAGHFLHLGRPELVNEAIRWLLDKPVTPRGPVSAVDSETEREKRAAQRVVIFGGLGNVGRALVRQAVACGHPTSMAVRRPDDVVGVFGPHLAREVTIHHVDSMNPDDVARALQGADIAINAAGNSNLGDAFLTLSEVFITQAARVLTGDKRVWVLGGLVALNVPHTRVTGDQLMVPAQFKLHRHNLVRLRDSGLAWSMACPGPMINSYPAPHDTPVNISIEQMPFDMPKAAGKLPAPLLTAALLPRIKHTKVTYHDVAEQIFQHIDDETTIRRRVGFGLG